MASHALADVNSHEESSSLSDQAESLKAVAAGTGENSLFRLCGDCSKSKFKQGRKVAIADASVH